MKDGKFHPITGYNSVKKKRSGISPSGIVIRKLRTKKPLDFGIAFDRFQEFLETNTEDDFTYDPQDDIVYLFKDKEQNKRFFKKFFIPDMNKTKVWVIGTTNNTGSSLDAVGVRILESGYINEINKGRQTFFGGFKDKRTGKQFVDISIALTTTKLDAVRRAKDQIQDVIIGISSKGGIEAVPLPKINLPKQGSEPVL